MKSTHLCECGCGEFTSVIAVTNRGAGRIKGQPSRFVQGHHRRSYTMSEEQKAKIGRANRGKTGPLNGKWKGGRYVHPTGYVYVLVGPDRPMARKDGYVREHRLVMSQMIGRPLRREEVVHHIDGNRSNNDPSNLQLFESKGAHRLHHIRLKYPEAA